SLTVSVYKSPLRIAFLQPSGALISEDLPSLPVVFDGSGFKIWKTMPEDEHYFGLGDKTGPMDHRDLAFTMWNTDAFGWQESTDPLYKDIPFIFALRNGASYVIYLDIDYQKNNRPFTVDTERFPNFQGMIKDLRAEGFKVVAITDLHIADLPGYRPYDEGMKSDYFVKNPDGSVYVGKVWPGDS